jgi:hypothetical protein
MSNVGAQPSDAPDDHAWVDELQDELDRVRTEQMRTLTVAPAPSVDAPHTPMRVELDNATIEAIARAVTTSIEQRLPALVEEAMRTVTADAAEVARTDLLQALAQAAVHAPAAPDDEPEPEPEPVFEPRGLGRPSADRY